MRVVRVAVAEFSEQQACVPYVQALLCKFSKCSMCGYNSSRIEDTPALTVVCSRKASLIARGRPSFRGHAASIYSNAVLEPIGPS